MSSLTLSPPDSLKHFIEDQAEREGLASPEAYALSLVREARKQAARGRVEKLLLDGLNSGEPIEVNEAFWEEKHRRLRERFPDETDAPDLP